MRKEGVINKIERTNGIISSNNQHSISLISIYSLWAGQVMMVIALRIPSFIINLNNFAIFQVLRQTLIKNMS